MSQKKEKSTPKAESPVYEKINVSGISIDWKPDKGICTFEDLPVAMMWIDSTLMGLMSGVQSMVGTDRFGLALQSEGRKSVEDDWKVISQFPNFQEGYKAIANIAAVAGWGKWQLMSIDEKKKKCHFRVWHSWEGRYQKALGICWGSGMLAGKMAGYCSKLFKINCWAEQTAFIAGGDEYDEFIVQSSDRSIEKEIEHLLASDEATRADMAVAMQKLRTEITERKKTEQLLELLNIQLSQKNRELEQVVYVTSHDLRSPLVNIEGYSGELGTSVNEILSVLDNEGVSSDMKERLAPCVKDIQESMTYISKGISRMESLLNGLLRFSRLGMIEIKKEELDMNMLMSDILSGFKFQVEEKKAKLEIKELPPCMGDDRQINQLFTNLISNALKYCDPDRPCIIKVSGQKENAFSVYCVEDSGIGIAPEHHGKIFEIFHQLYPREGGEGLGLSIAHKIVERHNGRIWVESEPGRGSKFYVSL